MKIFGIGSDIVDIRRIKKSILQNKKFTSRVFSKKEIALANKKKNVYNYFAKRYAAKEAFSKSLGTGISNGLKFSEIEVLNNKNGKPIMQIKGKSHSLVLKFLRKKNYNIFLSISDEKDYAIANVTLVIQ